MKEIIILSASGTAHELKDLILDSSNYRFSGFLDDYKKGHNIIGSIREWEKFRVDNLFVSALGNYRYMNTRKKILDKIPMECFITFIHETAYIYPSANILTASVIFPYSIISAKTTIGIHTLIYNGATIAHDTKVGDFSIISNGVNISGFVSIGENTYIGVGAVVKEGITIGNNCIVAAGSTVIHNVPDMHTYISPKKIKLNQHHLDSLV